MSKSNAEVLLLRAVAKQPPLYDRTAENYRKRLPCENSWDIVASETGESGELGVWLCGCERDNVARLQTVLQSNLGCRVAWDTYRLSPIDSIMRVGSTYCLAVFAIEASVRSGRNSPSINLKITNKHNDIID